MSQSKDLVSWKLDYEAVEYQKPVIQPLRVAQSQLAWFVMGWFNWLSVSAHIVTWTLAKAHKRQVDRFVDWLGRV